MYEVGVVAVTNIYVCTMVNVLGILPLQVVRDGTPQLVIVPFPCVLVLRCTYYFVCFLPSGGFSLLYPVW